MVDRSDKPNPTVSIVNVPVMMINMPPALTAATGMDALTHAIEAYAGKSTESNGGRCEKSIYGSI